MPYIDKEARSRIGEISNNAISPGELNYIISRHIDEYIFHRGLRYDTLNEAIGVLECVKQELYRRIVAPYENVKLIDNGDVFECQPTPYHNGTCGLSNLPCKTVDCMTCSYYYAFLAGQA